MSYIQSPPLRTLHIRFSLPLRPAEIPAFRGAVALDAGWEQDLFHNHATTEVVPEARLVPVGSESGTPDPRTLTPATLKDKSLNRYPLIHYRVEQGKAALFGLNEGATALRQWLLRGPGEVRVGRRKESLLIDHLQERQHELAILPEMRSYRLLDYLALNQENYRIWQEQDDLLSRMQLLQGALTGHLLGLATAMNFRIPDRQLKVQLLHLRSSRPVRLHQVQHLAFGLVYRTNLALPDDIAFGKGISHGYGVQHLCNEQ